LFPQLGRYGITRICPSGKSSMLSLPVYTQEKRQRLDDSSDKDGIVPVVK
jgi:hypothetical protein